MPARYFDAQTLYADNSQSVALIELNGVNDVVLNLGSLTTYEVIAGEGQFAVQFNESTPRQIIPVQAGSKVTINPGWIYQDRGELVMLATSKPPFNPSKTRTIKESERLEPLSSVIL